MRTLFRPAAIALATLLVAAACTSAASPTPAPSAAPSVAPVTAAPETAAPSLAASEAPSAAPSVAPSPTPEACAPGSLATVTPGRLTIGTDNPAYPPYFEPSDPNPAPWELGDPTNANGFESAVAYAVAMKLGFTPDQVDWVYVPFTNSYAPGPKTFDFDINQVSWKPERAEVVDLSRSYYFVNQSVVTKADSPLAAAKTVADMKKFKFGAQVGTTSYDTIVNVIAPTQEPAVYDTNDAAIEALKAGQIDGIVVDLPTAFYMTAAQLDNGVIVGQFISPADKAGEYFSLVLAKDSPLTPCVDQVLLGMRSDGSLDTITKVWLSEKVNAPVIAP
ncbi:MAG: transporter substrate-binding domain-containing protein [Chloroflexota bacterium]